MNPSVFWFTGLSGAGKTTVATTVLKQLQKEGKRIVLLDGDVLRDGLCSDLAFSIADRTENIRRVAEVSKLFLENNTSCLCTFISPTASIRKIAKTIIGYDNFNEIYVNTPLQVCEERDPKGLYKKVRNGEITNFTGIDSVYEMPEHPDLILDCNENTIQQSVEHTIAFIQKKTS